MSNYQPISYRHYQLASAELLLKASSLLRAGMLPIDHQLVKWYLREHAGSDQHATMGIVNKMIHDQILNVRAEVLVSGVRLPDGTSTAARRFRALCTNNTSEGATQVAMDTSEV